jgi:hypothetical protein
MLLWSEAVEVAVSAASRALRAPPSDLRLRKE